jgi:hypothetical protein
MTSYEEILTTGDNVENNIIAGDEKSYLLQVIQGTPIMDPEKPDEEMIRVMPLKSHLKSPRGVRCPCRDGEASETLGGLCEPLPR